MRLVQVKTHTRKFHFYFLNENVSLQNDSDSFVVENMNVTVSRLTIEKLFRMIKTSLDLKCEVIVSDNLITDIDYQLLHKKHFAYVAQKYFYLNISIKNKIVSFYNDHSEINDISSLENNNKIINFFSN